MYIMYVDESGDSGLINSPTHHYVLTGIVFHEYYWEDYFNKLVIFRKKMLHTFGLHMREEIHAAKFISRPGDFARIKKNDRLTILRHFTSEIALMENLQIINIVVDKTTKDNNYEVFEMAWKALVQRFENTIHFKNFGGHHNDNDRATIIADNTDNKKLVTLIRQLRRYNPIPVGGGLGPGYRNFNTKYMVEDPNFRDSKSSYFIQAADLAAYLLYQYYWPNTYMLKKSGRNYFTKLEPILCKKASKTDSLGIVWL